MNCVGYNSKKKIDMNAQSPKNNMAILLRILY